jgi:hypothetical protein
VQNAASGCRIAPYPLHLALRRATHISADKYDTARNPLPSARMTDPERTAQVLVLLGAPEAPSRLRLSSCRQYAPSRLLAS